MCRYVHERRRDKSPTPRRHAAPVSEKQAGIRMYEQEDLPTDDDATESLATVDTIDRTSEDVTEGSSEELGTEDNAEIIYEDSIPEVPPSSPDDESSMSAELESQELENDILEARNHVYKNDTSGSDSSEGADPAN